MQFDIDTPADLAILKLWLETKPLDHLELNPIRDFLQARTELLQIPGWEVLAKLGDFNSQVLVSGRVSANLHRALETRSHGQTRVLSEERGMRAAGREDRGEVVSLAGIMLEELGPVNFFKKLASSCQAALIDSRVLFAHLKWQVSQRDRFNSDAFQPDQILDEKVRAFTEAALEAHHRWNFPVLLGGHSLVSGGLLLLLDLLPPRIDY